MKLGLALAGGGVKGAAHIGVLKAFEEENIKIDYISGASSGSIVATLYAIGYKPDEIYALFQKYCKQINYFNFKNILKLIWGIIIKRKIIINGLNDGKKLEKIINNSCCLKNIKTINQIKMPIIIPSVEVNNGQLYIFSSMQNRNTYIDDIKYIYNIEIAKAVRASCSYPGVFEPYSYEDKAFIDGAIRENVPWKELKKMGAEKVISVVFEKKLKNKKNRNIIEVVSSSIDILSHELSNYELQGADALLKIKTEDISLLDTSKIEYLYKKGYETAKKKIKNILNN